MSSTTEFITNFKEAGLNVISTRRPWSQLLSPFALSLPSSLPDAASRLSLNLSHFLSNYAQILLLFLYISLIFRPFTLLVLFFLQAAWYFLFFARDEPLNLFNLVVLDDRAVVFGLSVLTLVDLLVANAWFNLVVSLLVGAAVVCLHAVLRSTEDVVGNDNDESPYGPMLGGGGGGDGDNAGAYTLV